MSDLSSYRQQVTEYGKKATEAEKNEQWDQAYGHYMAALEVFMHLIKCRSNLKFMKQLLIIRTLFYSRKKSITQKTLHGQNGPVHVAC